MIEEREKNNIEVKLSKEVQEMTVAGLCFGHRVSKIHPKMKPYISGTRNGIHIINLEKTEEMLKEALDFLKQSKKDKKKFLLVGTKIQVRDLVKKAAGEANIPYVSGRWLGGTLTNFKIIRKRVDYFIDLEKQKETGALQKYTKKERVKFDRELKNLEVKFGGIKTLESKPDIIIVLDMKKDDIAVKEAKDQKIKVVAIADTNVNPILVDYPIPANDDAISSVQYIVDKIIEVIK